MVSISMDAVPSQPQAPLVRSVSSPEDLQAALRIRLAVFVHEQGVPPEEEIDLRDLDADHMLAELGRDPVGTARVVRLDAGTARIGRVAVVRRCRGLGVGRALMRACEAAARPWARCIVLDAQAPALGFYERLGYVREGDVFLDCGIEHVRMRLAL
ncbi:MAG: GNAT family N-acetyltransferase [Armatimonadetes bacterium]|nr:GNAT family N-acetyltransferase [Armatimonadota bacterium]